MLHGGGGDAAAVSARLVYTIQPCTTSRKVRACLAVTCHLHFWQNDRALLRATAVTRGWNGYRNKSQHRQWTLETKILRAAPAGTQTLDLSITSPALKPLNRPVQSLLSLDIYVYEAWIQSLDIYVYEAWIQSLLSLDIYVYEAWIQSLLSLDIYVYEAWIQSLLSFDIL